MALDERRTQHATLGCGSLILSALIVLFFGRPGFGDLEREVRSLCSEVGKLKTAVEGQTRLIKELGERLGRRGQGRAPGAKDGQ